MAIIVLVVVVVGECSLWVHGVRRNMQLKDNNTNGLVADGSYKRFPRFHRLHRLHCRDGASTYSAGLQLAHDHSWVYIEALLGMHVLCKLPQLHPVAQDPVRAQILQGSVEIEACIP